MNPVIYSPNKIFEDSNTNVIPIVPKHGSIAAAANSTIVSAVSGKRIAVIGGFFQSNATTNTGQIAFYSASTGGTLLAAFGTPARDTYPPFLLPLLEGGGIYFETVTGEALVAAASSYDQLFTIQTITYTP